MFKTLFGDPNTRKIKKFHPVVAEINALEADIHKLSDQQLKYKTNEFRELLETVNSDEELRNILNRF